MVYKDLRQQNKIIHKKNVEPGRIICEINMPGDLCLNGIFFLQVYI